ncbi:hypothetical protein [Pseudomonas sp.]|uniref:hypothetical protein n=1 Tax=Pseudomonas sp. TaxID=306 RepID=UPI0028A84E76|nr:hypothetical protein [Pseudomonas sp.]
MPYVAVNLTNDYDTAYKTCYATQEADARAREILNQFASVQMGVCQVLKDYSAKISITAKEPAAGETEPPTA